MARWLNDTGAALPWRSDARYVEVFYEQLVSAPEATMRSVLGALDEPWDSGVLRHHEVDRDASHFPQNPEANRPVTDERVGRWRCDLTADEIAYIERRIGERLRRFGYSCSPMP